jgi:hypothetical protein
MRRLGHICTRFYCEVCTAAVVAQDALGAYLPHVGHNHTGFGL